MFEQETVFILGAGASKPYGYPLGEELILDIVKNIENDEIYLPHDNKLGYVWNYNDEIYKFDDFEEIFNQLLAKEFRQQPIEHRNGLVRFENNGRLCLCVKLNKIDKFKDLQEKLKNFSPISIDSFIRNNPSHAYAAKIMIIYSLLKKEDLKSFEIITTSTQPNIETHISDNWYSHLINDLTSGCNEAIDILKNKFTAVTFNYDLSLEYGLHKILLGMEFFKENNASRDFVENLKNKHIKHVYGQLYAIEKLQDYGLFYNSTKPYGNMARFIKAFQEKDNIKTIQEERRDGKFSGELKDILKGAKQIIIIGFGFDRDNLDILGFPDKLSGYTFFKGKKIKYLDYKGSMQNLANEFISIQDTSRGQNRINVIRSTASNITNAYQNDFKISLFK